VISTTAIPHHNVGISTINDTEHAVNAMDDRLPRIRPITVATAAIAELPQIELPLHEDLPLTRAANRGRGPLRSW